MKRIMLSLAIALLMATHLFAQNNPTTLYLDIAKSIATASGNADLYFTEGNWVKVINNKRVIVSFSEGQRANIKFSYSGGQLQDGARIAFSPGIHVYVRVPSGGLSLRLDTLWLDDNGKFKDWRVKYDNPPTNDLNQVPTAQDAFRLNDKSESLFTTKLFRVFQDAKRSDASGTLTANSSNKPMLTSIIVKKPNDTEAGLSVSLIPNSTLHFSSQSTSGTYDNKVSFNTGNLEIRYLEYDIFNKKVQCEVAQFDVNLQSGILQTSDMLINISSGSKLTFNRLKIYRDNNSSDINAENGTFHVQVSGGTKISLNKTTKYKSELIFDNGEMNLFDFGYQCNEDKKTIFKIGGGSTLKVATRSGSLSLCEDKGYLSISSGRLEAAVFGTWNSQAANPDAHLAISLLTVSLDGGYLPISNENIVGIKSGFIKSESLRFDGLTYSSLLGEIKDLNVVLNDESKFLIPGGIKIEMKDGSVIDGAEPNNPLRLDVSNKYVSGLFKLNLNFSTLSSSANELIKLHDGLAKLKVEVLGNDTIRARDIYFKGTAKIEAQNTSLNCTLELLNGILISVKGKEPELTAGMKIQLDQSNPIEINTPYVRPNDETRVFPLKLSFTLSEAAISQETQVKFTGQSIMLNDIDIAPKFTLVVPQGRGEHKDENDPNSANGSEGPDWCHVCQEVAFYDCPNPIGVSHFYIFPETYQIKSVMRLGIADKTISFNFGKLEFEGGLRWEKDGCDLATWVGIVGVIAGGLVAGPMGSTVGGITGIVVGGDLETNLKGIINSGIARKTTDFNFNKQWKFK